MTITTLSDRFLSAWTKRSQSEDAFQAKQRVLKRAEQELLQYTAVHQNVPDQAEYVGEGSWKAFGCFIQGMKYHKNDEIWLYVTSGTHHEYIFQDFVHAVTFIAGFRAGDEFHEQLAKEKKGDATDLTVAT